MSGKTLMIVRAFKGAEETLQRHAPHFDWHRLPIMGYSPQDGTVFPWAWSMAYGASAHSGPAMVSNTQWLMTVLSTMTEYDRFIVTEYDQLLLGDLAPYLAKVKDGVFVSPAKKNTNPRFGSEWYPSVPWLFTRQTATWFKNHLWSLANDNEKVWEIEGGYDDRAMGLVLNALKEPLKWVRIAEHFTEDTENYWKSNPNMWTDIGRGVVTGKIKMVHQIKTADQLELLRCAIRGTLKEGLIR